MAFIGKDGMERAQTNTWAPLLITRDKNFDSQKSSLCHFLSSLKCIILLLRSVLSIKQKLGVF